MKIHEYQAKDVLRRYGVPVPQGFAAFSVEEAVAAADKLPGNVYVCKAQIHAGGRGKGGGVKVCKSKDELREKATAILGMNLVTHQTGPQGRVVKRLYVEQGLDIKRELYLAMLLDREASRLVVMCSTEGGMEIEEVAAHHPELIFKIWIDPAVGLQAFQGRLLAYKLGLEGKSVGKFAALLDGCYRCYLDTDASMVEINPLVVTGAGDVVALDAKVGFDDNGLFRHKDIAELRDLDEEDAREVEASKWDLNYIHLDGTVGCLVNGAGLAMATMDVLKHYDGEPANFLDVGGSATTERVAAAFRIILSDSRVKAIFVNIFGGIMKCDTIAEGIVAASKEVGLDRPLVVRLEGTNVDLGRKILAESGLPIISAQGMKDGADKAVAATRKAA